MARYTRKTRENSEFDTVGVVGSIPIARTITGKPGQPKIIEIPGEYEVVPAVRWIRGRPQFYRVLYLNPQKRCEKGVKSKTRKRA